MTLTPQHTAASAQHTLGARPSCGASHLGSAVSPCQVSTQRNSESNTPKCSTLRHNSPNTPTTKHPSQQQAPSQRLWHALGHNTPRPTALRHPLSTQTPTVHKHKPQYSDYRPTAAEPNTATSGETNLSWLEGTMHMPCKAPIGILLASYLQVQKGAKKGRLAICMCKTATGRGNKFDCTTD